MIVIPPRAEPIQRRHCIPNKIAIAQPPALLTGYPNSQLVTRCLPHLKKAVRFGVSRPGAVLGQNLHLYFARMTVRRAAHFARTSERRQTSLPLFVCFL